MYKFVYGEKKTFPKQNNRQRRDELCSSCHEWSKLSHNEPIVSWLYSKKENFTLFYKFTVKFYNIQILFPNIQASE